MQLLIHLYSTYCRCLWPPYGIGEVIMATLWPLYFTPWFLLSSSIYLSFFPRLFSAVAYWMSTIPHRWCGLNANLGCRSETCCTRLAENQDAKSRQKIALWAPSHNFVGLYFRNESMYRQSEKNSLNSSCMHMSSQYGELRSTSGWDRFVSLEHPSKF